MEFKKYFLFIFLHCFLYTFNCFGQQQNYFTHFTTEDGLSQSSVFSITQDDIGFMWFATEDGLNKFDGNKFTVYRPKENDSTSIPDLGIRKVFKDAKGKIWILTLRGKLCRYDPIKNTFTNYTFASSNKISPKIITLTVDHDGKLWAFSTKGDIYFYNSNNDTFVKFESSQKFYEKVKSIHLQCAIFDKDNIIWLGTWEGLIAFNPGSNQIDWYKHELEISNSIGGDMVFSLTEDSKGNIWIASANGGVSVFNKSTKKFSVYKTNSKIKNTISSNRIMSLLIDSKNNIWIGTFDKGLDLFNPITKTFINISHNPSIQGSFSIGAVMSLYEDNSGGIWIGTGGGGLNRYDPLNQAFKHIQHIPGNPNSISPNPVLAICEDHFGNLWIGTDGGGINYKEKNSNSFINYLQNPAFGSNAITAIYEDSKGNIWIGADPGANSTAGEVILFYRNTNSFVPVNEISIKFGGVSAIHEDRFGELWIATASDGIHRYNPMTKKEIVYRTNITDSTTISSNAIFSICEDSYNNLWFGSISSGIVCFDRTKDSFIRFINDRQNTKSLGSNSIWCITEDSNRDLWIGTWGSGINKYIRDKKEFVRYTVKDGLPGNIVYGIESDIEGNLWISTNKGLTKFNPTNIEFKNFTKANGLLINNFSAGATFSTQDGRLFFGGNSGAVYFNPRQIAENDYIPNVVLTDFKVFDKSLQLPETIEYTNKINLNYNQNFFTIEFAALDYNASDKNLYEYKLEGVDVNWVKAIGRRFASYTDINDGEYKFRLRGSNSSGIFNQKDVVLNIVINPPFWKTWWFKSLGTIVLILILYSIHKYRLNRLIEVERTRNKIARDLHDEVSASVTGIVYFAEAVKSEVKEKETPALNKLIGLISESATQIQESMSDIIWSINPDNDDWNVVLPKFRRYASDLCESKGISYSIEMPESFSGKSLKMEQRHDLWLVFKEIVTNSVKHSQCKKLNIKLFTDSDFLYLEISDNGIGFNSEIPSANNGVKNIKARSKTLNGTSELITSFGNGTQWKIKIPLT